jgi:hypothetical protein
VPPIAACSGASTTRDTHRLDRRAKNAAPDADGRCELVLGANPWNPVLEHLAPHGRSQREDCQGRSHPAECVAARAIVGCIRSQSISHSLNYPTLSIKFNQSSLALATHRSGMLHRVARVQSVFRLRLLQGGPPAWRSASILSVAEDRKPSPEPSRGGGGGLSSYLEKQPNPEKSFPPLPSDPLPPFSVSRLRELATKRAEPPVRPARARLDPTLPGPPPEAYVANLLKRCVAPLDVLDLFEQEVQAFDLFNYGAAGAKLLSLYKAKAPYKRQSLPRSRVARFLAGMARGLEETVAAPPIGVLAHMARTASELGLEDPTFYRRIAAAALPQVATAAQPKDVAMLATALAKCGARDPQLFQEFASRVVADAGRYNLLELQMIAASFSDSELEHLALLDCLEDKVLAFATEVEIVPRISPEETRLLATAVTQTARFGRVSGGKDLLKALEPLVAKHCKRMLPRDLSNVLHAYAASGRIEFLPLVKETLRSFIHPQRLAGATPNDLVMVLRALASIKGAVAQVMASSPLTMQDLDPTSKTTDVSAYLEVDRVVEEVSKHLVRHIDPVSTGHDPLSRAVADAASPTGRAGPYLRHPSVPPSPVHCLHALQAQRDLGVDLSAEARVKIAGHLAASPLKLKPDECVDALLLVAQSVPPRRAVDFAEQALKQLARDKWTAFRVDPSKTANLVVELLPLCGAARTALPASASQPVDNPRVRSMACHAVQAACTAAGLRSTALTAQQRTSLVWGAGTSRVVAPEVMVQGAQDLGRLLANNGPPGPVTALVVALASAGHPTWTDPLSPLSVGDAVNVPPAMATNRGRPSRTVDIAAPSLGAIIDQQAVSSNLRKVSATPLPQWGGAGRSSEVLPGRIDSFWTDERIRLLGPTAASALRASTLAWWHRTAHRGKASPVQLGAIAWALAAASREPLQLSSAEFLDALSLPLDESNASRLAPLVLEAASLLGGPDLAAEAVGRTPWLKPPRHPLTGCLLPSGKVEASVANDLSLLLGSDKWLSRWDATAAALVASLRERGWEAQFAGEISPGLSSDILLSGPAKVCVVASTRLNEWNHRQAGCLPPERVRRSLLRSVTGLPLVKIDMLELVKQAEVQSVSAALAEAAAAAAEW